MEKNLQILDAARKLFSQFGLKKVSIDDIVREARISKATIYRHYRNKQEIYNEVVSYEADQLMTAITVAVDREKTVRGKLQAHLLTKIGKLRELVNLYRLTSEVWSEHWPDGSNTQQRLLSKEREMVIRILKLGNMTGELHAERPELTAHILVLALKSLENPWAVDDYDVSLSELVDHMLEILLNGIGKS